ncbi:ATP-grasp domain-containing protein [Kineosporia babensis]|uniref:ATP-grasp domain-containing protein n=2 Tax=Kineosporia babensis TaxID=499548 RepID=A0A9X1NAD4_9ACTN|nr:ATP-grasp domain-containing protein [Kineosporia babensis]MCD5310478.1 ATP-grasp domain-containing protein [Kineosporia babensis]
MLLVPGDPLRPRRPDEHYAAEAAHARDLGLEVVCVDHDALVRGDARSVVVKDGGRALYRGWMLSASQYAGLAQALEAQGVQMVTSAEDYRRAHELPCWYRDLASVTPQAAWSSDDSREGFDHARSRLGSGAAVLRDYTKSMKHYWHEAAFIPDLEDAQAAWKVASRFRELREDDFTGGYVLRRFEEFGPAEVRTWWVGGVCVLAGPHPDSPEALPAATVDTQPYASIVGALGLPFVTVDLAQRRDGVWRVIELGDGQVSDCPASNIAELAGHYASLG